MATDTAERTETAETTGEAAPKAPRKVNGVYVSTPQILREKLEAEAEAAGTSVAGMVRDLLAKRYDLELPKTESPIRKKYATKEDAKQAQRKARFTRQEAVKALMEAHKLRMAGKVEEANAVEARATGLMTGQIEVELPAPKAAKSEAGSAEGEGESDASGEEGAQENSAA